MQIQDKLFIAGRFVPAADGATLPSLNPHDCSRLADVAMAVLFPFILSLMPTLFASFYASYRDIFVREDPVQSA